MPNLNFAQHITDFYREVVNPEVSLRTPLFTQFEISVFSHLSERLGGIHKPTVCGKHQAEIPQRARFMQSFRSESQRCDICNEQARKGN